MFQEVRVGLPRTFDFLYVPADFGRGAGLGYAFVNFVSNAEAMRAWQHLKGFTSWGMRSAKARDLHGALERPALAENRELPLALAWVCVGFSWEGPWGLTQAAPERREFQLAPKRGQLAPETLRDGG